MKRLIPLLLSCLLLCSACAAPGAGPAAAGTDTLREVCMVLDWYPNALHAFLYTAIEQGYFAEEGLSLTLQFPSNANDAISLVAAGKADIGLYYQQDAMIARVNQDVPVKSIGAVVQAPLSIVLSLKDKHISSPRDLEGKTVGYGGTALSEAIVRSLMEHEGADFSSVSMVDVGFDLMSSMTTGNVDATIGCLVNHEVPQLEKEGFPVNFFPLDQYGVPTYYELVFLSSDKTIAEEPEVLAGFLRACARGFADQKANPEGALDSLLLNQNAENFPLNRDVERRSLETLLPLMETAQSPFLSQSDHVWQENIDWLVAQGLLSRAPALDELRVDLTP